MLLFLNAMALGVFGVAGVYVGLFGYSNPEPVRSFRPLDFTLGIFFLVLAAANFLKFLNG